MEAEVTLHREFSIWETDIVNSFKHLREAFGIPPKHIMTGKQSLTAGILI